MALPTLWPWFETSRLDAPHLVQRNPDVNTRVFKNRSRDKFTIFLYTLNQTLKLSGRSDRVSCAVTSSSAGYRRARLLARCLPLRERGIGNWRRMRDDRVGYSRPGEDTVRARGGGRRSGCWWGSPQRAPWRCILWCRYCRSPPLILGSHAARYSWRSRFICSAPPAGNCCTARSPTSSGDGRPC